MTIGELLGDCQLASKRTLGTGKQEFIEEKKEGFEAYLQVCFTLKP